MDILEELDKYICNFNMQYHTNYNIDSIRINFSKQYKLEPLKKLGQWKKLPKSSNILHKLKKRLTPNEITSVWRLSNYNIYYYNQADKSKKYRKATMIIFGLKQYHQEVPPKYLVQNILKILKNVTNIDICLDVTYKPNIENLKQFFELKQYVTNKGVKTQTYYINNPDIIGIEKIIIYDKGFKNSLNYTLWRFEAKVLINNINELYLPLYEFKELIDYTKIN
jgi:hypothetical protein